MVANIKMLSEETHEGMCLYTMGETAGDLEQEGQPAPKRLKAMS